MSYLFSKKGQLLFAAPTPEERLLEIALETGAEDVNKLEDGMLEVITDPEQFITVKSALAAQQLIPEQAEITLLASVQISLDRENAEKMLRLLNLLEALDDVQQVYSNADIPDDLLATL